MKKKTKREIIDLLYAFSRGINLELEKGNHIKYREETLNDWEDRIWKLLIVLDKKTLKKIWVKK